MEQEYSYWEITFINCESDERWTIARAPIDWDDYQVRERISNSNEDVARVLGITPTSDTDYGWDFVD